MLVVIGQNSVVHAVVDHVLVLKVIAGPELQRRIGRGELDHVVIFHIGAILKLTLSTVYISPQRDGFRFDFLFI